MSAQPSLQERLHPLRVRNPLARPSDFCQVAREHGAEVYKKDGRWIATKRRFTVGFSDHHDRPYNPTYRRILIKIFASAGLLALLLGVLRIIHL